MHMATLSSLFSPEFHGAETNTVEPLRLFTLPQRVSVRVDMRAMNLVNNASVIADVGG